MRGVDEGFFEMTTLSLKVAHYTIRFGPCVLASQTKLDFLHTLDWPVKLNTFPLSNRGLAKNA